MFYTTLVLVFPSNTVIAQYKTYYEQNGYVTNIFINLSLGHISNILVPVFVKLRGESSPGAQETSPPSPVRRRPPRSSSSNSSPPIPLKPCRARRRVPR